jgi:cardiolipin synthase
MEPAEIVNDQNASATADFQWLKTGEEAITAMLNEIAAATASIRLETYIFHTGPVADDFRRALVAAAQRGVKVRLIIDALGSLSLSTAFWEPLTKMGGEFIWFNPISLTRWSCRDHRKVMVVDDRVAFIGGFNIADEYKGDGVTHGWRDLGLRMTGAIVPVLARSFDSFFERADFRQRLLRRFRRKSNNVAEGANWKVVLSGPGNHHGELRRTLGQDLARAQSVKIICAYFLPSWRLRKQLQRISNQGGRVQLILAGKTDVLLTQLAGRHLYRMLMRSGVEIYEYQPQILHSKLYIFDDVVYVGSANFDVRSLRINYELLVRLADPKLAAEAAEIFENDLKHSRRIDPSSWRTSRSFLAKLKENWAYFVLAKMDPYFARRQIRLLR